MLDSTNLTKDLLGKFDIEHVFCKIFPFPGIDKDIFFHQTKKGKIYILFYLNLQYISTNYIYITVMIHISEHHFTRYMKNINCILYYAVTIYYSLLS